MNNILIGLLLVVIVGLAVIVLILLKRKPAQDGKLYEYRKRPPLTADEQLMYQRLLKILPNHTVLAKIALNRCVRVRGPAPSPIADLTLDFVICNPGLEIVAAIEIEGNDGPTLGSQTPDQIKERVLDAVGIELIRWPANHLPNEAEIANEFRDTLLTVMRDH